MITLRPKVVVFGDSLFKGVIYDEKAERYHLIKKSCAEMLIEYLDMTCDNLSRFGMTSSKAVDYIKNSLKRSFQYKYAIIELGGNDCDYNWQEIAKNPNEIHYPNVCINDFEKNINIIIDEIEKYEIIPIIVSLPPISAKKYFQFVSKSLDKENILKWLKEENNIYKHHEMYNLCLGKIARKKKIRMIDLRLALLTIKDFEKYLCADGIHLNENGHYIIEQSFKKGELIYE